MQKMVRGKILKLFLLRKKEKLNRSFSIIGPRKAGKTYLMYLTIKESIKNIKKDNAQ
jgi:predicted AAA+ superfamily ATPase